MLGTGMTAVRGEHRGPNLGLALKLRAKAGGNARIHSNNATNEPILAINERLGFVRQAAQIELVKNPEP